MPSFRYGDTVIEYTIRYKPNIKNVTIYIDHNEGVKIIAPTGTKQDLLKDILHKKSRWIIKKQKEIDDIKKLSPSKEFRSGEEFPYMGRNYPLEIDHSDPTSRAGLKFRQGVFRATLPKNLGPKEREMLLRQLFKDWYISRGQEKIKERVEHYCPILKVTPTKVLLKDQKTLWGSCTKKGTININWRIIMAPPAVIDYLVVHELAHLKHPNHSDDFWHLVQLALPDYRERRKWLHKFGPTLAI